MPDTNSVPVEIDLATCTLLGDDQRRDWCADIDLPTGYVCRRLRNHGGRVHVGVNSVGGFHQWSAAVSDEPADSIPAAIPATTGHQLGAVYDVGAVPVVDGELDFSALADACEEYVRAYRGSDDPDLPVLVDAITKALGRPAAPTVDGDHLAAENARLATELDQVNTDLRRLMLDYGFGATGHLVEVVTMFVRNLVGQVLLRDAEIDRLRASREAWAIEAVSQDGLADRFLGWHSRLYDAVSKAAKLPPSPSVDDVVDAVARLARELADARADLDTERLRTQAWAEAAARWESAASRPAIPADAENRLARELELAALGDDPNTDLQEKARELLAEWFPAVAVPANDQQEQNWQQAQAVERKLEELRAQLRDWATTLARGSGDVPAVDVAWKLRQIADGNDRAPAVGSDTDITAACSACPRGDCEDCDGCRACAASVGCDACPDATSDYWRAGDLALDRTNFVWWRDYQGWRPIVRYHGYTVFDRDLGRFLGPLVKLTGLPPEMDKLGSVPAAVAAQLRAVPAEQTGDAS